MSNDITRQGSFNVYQGMMDRALLQIKLAGSQRMSADLAKLNEKYDGKTASRVEDQINKLGGEKTVVADWLRRVETGVKAMNDIRIWMLEMKNAIKTGSGPAFDNALDKNNYDVNRGNGDSLIANPGKGRGFWSQKTEVVSSGPLSAQVTSRFLGNDYIIETDDGNVFKPGSDSSTVQGNGTTFETANLTVDSFDSATNTVVFTDPDSGTQYTGTVKRGGLGVLPAWLYGNFATEDDKTRANADIATALRGLARAELRYNVDQAQLSGMDTRLKSSMDELGAEYKKLVEGDLTAKQAERRAIQTRFDIFNNSLALTSARSQQFIYHMFMTNAQPEKLSMKDIMLNQVR